MPRNATAQRSPASAPVQLQPVVVAATPVEFNSVAARQIAGAELDAWATEHTEAARALKTLVLDLIRSRKIVGDKAIMAELKTLEV